MVWAARLAWPFRTIGLARSRSKPRKINGRFDRDVPSETSDRAVHGEHEDGSDEYASAVRHDEADQNGVVERNWCVA